MRGMAWVEPVSSAAWPPRPPGPTAGSSVETEDSRTAWRRPVAPGEDFPVHTTGRRRGPPDLVAEDQPVVHVHPRADVRDGLPRPPQPSGGQVLLEAADPVEHVVHPAAGDLLHHGLEFLALAEGVEDGGDAAQFEGVRAEEHQVVEDPVQLGEERTGPHRALRDLHAQHPLDGHDHAELVGEGGEPVVTVGQHDDLPVVPRLEELLGTAVHVADHRLGLLYDLAVEHEPEPEHTVGRGMLRPDVQHHVGALRRAADADRRLRHAVSIPRAPAAPCPASRPPRRAAPAPAGSATGSRRGRRGR